jgi:hypothetical protein
MCRNELVKLGDVIIHEFAESAFSRRSRLMNLPGKHTPKKWIIRNQSQFSHCTVESIECVVNVSIVRAIEKSGQSLGCSLDLPALTRSRPVLECSQRSISKANAQLLKPKPP